MGTAHTHIQINKQIIQNKIFKRVAKDYKEKGAGVITVETGSILNAVEKILEIHLGVLIRIHVKRFGLLHCLKSVQG